METINESDEEEVDEYSRQNVNDANDANNWQISVSSLSCLNYDAVAEVSLAVYTQRMCFQWPTNRILKRKLFSTASNITYSSTVYSRTIYRTLKRNVWKSWKRPSFISIHTILFDIIIKICENCCITSQYFWCVAKIVSGSQSMFNNLLILSHDHCTW